MAYLLSESKKQLNTCSNDKSALEAEIASLNEMMYAQGVDVGADVKQNLQNMLTMYDKMEMENGAMNDSITAQKEKIQGLLADLESAKGDKRRYASKVMKLEKEAETLRSIMKDYIRTIDSLNTANGVLTENLNSTLADLDQMTSSRDSYQSTATELTDKVNKGSKLTASGFLSEGIKEKGTDRKNPCRNSWIRTWWNRWRCAWHRTRTTRHDCRKHWRRISWRTCRKLYCRSDWTKGNI
jgi:chromosome segregation ATPase